jgi:hypothetical protein
MCRSPAVWPAASADSQPLAGWKIKLENIARVANY